MAIAELNKITSVSIAIVHSLITLAILQGHSEEAKTCIIQPVIDWLKQVGKCLPDAYEPETPPQVGALVELETVVGSKNQDLALVSG